MAEEKEPAPGKKGWLKTIVGTVGGLMSGAVAMYATAAFNQVVKPAKPVANFKYEAAGASVTFHNLSGVGQGWWDFGDGSALEPLANRTAVTHAYRRAGDYTVKLSLQNILGEEAERSVVVHVDPAGSATADGPPQVASLQAEPVSPGSYAPATFRLIGKVNNAQLCLLDFGDERPPEIVSGVSADRLVTFKEAGGHIVKLMAINGPRVDTKTEIVNVEESPTGTISAVLKISDTAHRLVVRERGLELHAGAPQPADDGFLITDVSVPTNGQPIAMQGKTELPLDPAAVGQKNARDLKLQILDGGKSLQLTGEPGKNWRGQPQPLKLTLILTEQKREPVTQERETSTTVAVPVGRQPSTASAALPSVPGDWVEIQRRASLRLLDGDKVLWEGPVPGSAPLAIGHRSCLLTTTAAKGQVFLNLRDAAAATPAAN